MATQPRSPLAPEPLDDLVKVVSPMGWLAQACLAGLILAIVLWAVFGRIPITVMGSGILTRPHRVVALQATGAGQIDALRIQPGARIEAGEAIATLSQPDLSAQLLEQRAKLALFDAHSRELIDLQTQRNREEAQAIESQRRNLLRLIAQAKELAPILKSRLDERRELLKLSALPVDAVLEAEQTLRANQDKIPDLEGQIRQLDLRKRQMAQQLVELETSRALQRKDLAASISLLENQRTGHGQIRSPYAGKVLEVAAAPGQMVAPGSRIATIAAEDPSEELVAVLYVPVRDGKKVQPGHSAQVTPDTVRRERFGGIQGTVKEVSAYPVTRQAIATTLGNEDMAATLANTGPQIQVEIALERAETPSGFRWSSSAGPAYPQTPGTTVTSRVLIDSMSPMELAFSLLRQASALY